jgi:hypothetical protein
MVAVVKSIKASQKLIYPTAESGTDSEVASFGIFQNARISPRLATAKTTPGVSQSRCRPPALKNSLLL